MSQKPAPVKSAQQSEGRPHQLGQDVFKVVLSEDVEWKPFAAFPPSVRLAVVVGEPSQPGPFTIRVKVPHGENLMPHMHPEDRVYTVISGVFYIGLGDEFNASKLEAYPPGAVIVLPGNTPHFHWAKSGEYVTQVSATGPLGLEYLNMKDDPRSSTVQDQATPASQWEERDSANRERVGNPENKRMSQSSEKGTTMATTKYAAVPGLMKAVRIAQYGGSDQLRCEEVPVPRMEPGHVLASVRYAGVNPVDWKIREGDMKQFFPVSFPLTLGHDFAGEIVSAAGDSERFRTGDRVFGFGDGTYAEFTAAAITDIVAVPGNIDFAIAAALPTPGLTALQAIRDYVQPKAGTRILIHGAAGAVGLFATQIAKASGAQVIGTATGDDAVYLRSLGYVQVVDYRHDRFEIVGQVDAVLDLIGGETAARSYAMVKKGGVMVSALGGADAEMAARAGIRGVNVAMKRSAGDLSELAALVERGDVKPRMGEVFRLDQAREAQDASQKGRARGKILLKIA